MKLNLNRFWSHSTTMNACNGVAVDMGNTNRAHSMIITEISWRKWNIRKMLSFTLMPFNMNKFSKDSNFFLVFISFLSLSLSHSWELLSASLSVVLSFSNFFIVFVGVHKFLAKISLNFINLTAIERWAIVNELKTRGMTFLLRHLIRRCFMTSISVVLSA